MDQVERMQIASISRILSNLLEPEGGTRDIRPWRRKSNAMAAAKAIRSNFVEREQLLPFLPSCNPGWRILIELYIADGENEPLAISDIGHVSAIPIATTLRWLTLLSEHGLLDRTPDANDRRRHWLNLTPKGHDIVEQIMHSLFDNMVSAVDACI